MRDAWVLKECWRVKETKGLHLTATSQGDQCGNSQAEAHQPPGRFSSGVRIWETCTRVLGREYDTYSYRATLGGRFFAGGQ